MRTAASWMVCFALSLSAGYANAQSTLGELLDKGAKKMSREEWQAQLPVTYGGLDFTERVNFKFEYKADGKFSGNATGTHGQGTSGSVGTWTMDETGKQCIDERLISWNMTWDECYFVYKLDAKYFSAQSDSDRSSKAMPRTFSSAKP